MADLKGTGRIYLIQMGPHRLPYSLDEFATWLKSKYSLDVQVLPPTKLDSKAWDSSRHQYVADLLYDQIKREHASLAADPNAYLMAFTDADMYSVRYFWDSAFALRDGHRAAVTSAARMQDANWERKLETSEAADRRLQQRLRRILLKNIAVQYWKLPQNEDPSSLLRWTVDPDLPTEDIYASDLHPERTVWGRSEGWPCVFLQYSEKDGLAPPPGDSVRGCSYSEDPAPDDSRETFQVDLGFGVLMDRHTDFYLPDSIPIQFERVTRDGWTVPFAFGLSGTDNYDTFLGSDDNMVTTDVIYDDGHRERLQRTPKWLPLLSFVKYVDTRLSGKFYELTWHLGPFEHFDLKRYDGQVRTFLPCDDHTHCYQVGLRNPDGQELSFQRDQQRRLTRLTSPDKQWLNVTYGPENAISQIQDSQGRKVEYRYDQRKRLSEVIYPSGETYWYEYDDSQHLLAFRVSRGHGQVPRLLLQNTYKDGKLATQTLSDGSTFSYAYDIYQGKVRRTFVRIPSGQVYEVDLSDDGSTVRELRNPPGLKPPDSANPLHAGFVWRHGG